MGVILRPAGTVMWIWEDGRSARPASSAAVSWLSVAPSPVRSTAAHSRQSRGRGPLNVAYTRPKTCCHRPLCSRTSMASSVRPAARATTGDGQHGLAGVGVEVVALVVDHDEGWEVDHLDAPDGFHAQLRVLQHLHLGDAVLRQAGRRTADRAEVEPAVALACLGHLT